MRFDSLAKGTDFQTEIETADGRRVPLKLVVNPRARRVSVRIDPMRREAVATAPHARHLKRAAQFASERAAWIASELSRLPQATALTPGAEIPLRGEPHRLLFERGRSRPRIEKDHAPVLIVPAPDTALFAPRLLRFLKEEARSDLCQSVSRYSDLLKVKPSRIQVKELRSRWGSCSADGVLSFAWRIVMAPPFVLDYLAAHEVAHLKEMNHSRRFWALVRQCDPGFERGRDWLREQGWALHAVGTARGV